MAIVRSIFLSLPAACASETVGSRTTARELVIADGKKIKGSAIPVSTPYVLRASALDRPNSSSLLGTKIASRLCRQPRISRLPISGRAIAINGAASDRKL